MNTIDCWFRKSDEFQVGAKTKKKGEKKWGWGYKQKKIIKLLFT